jgi:hypothetical protein
LLEEDFIANPLVANLHDLMKQVPYKIVFAYQGDSHDSILGHLQDYKTQNDVRVENLPDLIIVNNSYYIWKIGPKGGTDSEGKKYEYGDMIYEPNYGNIGGMAMLYMLTHVQKMTNLSSVVIFNFNKYFDAMDRIVRGM